MHKSESPVIKAMPSEMRVHKTSFVLHPRGMSSAPESRNLIFLPSLSPSSAVFTDPPPLSLSVCLTEGARRATTPRAAAQRPLCERMPHHTHSVRPSVPPSVGPLHPRRSVCTRCYILRADGGYAWDGHDSISPIQIM